MEDYRGDECERPGPGAHDSVRKARRGSQWITVKQQYLFSPPVPQMDQTGSAPALGAVRVVVATFVIETEL